jgi:hypothetical protein
MLYVARGMGYCGRKLVAIIMCRPLRTEPAAVDAGPIADIMALPRVASVMKDGKVYRDVGDIAKLRCYRVRPSAVRRSPR